MSTMLSKFFKRFKSIARVCNNSYYSSTSKKDIYSCSTLRDHLAASKIQLAYRRHKMIHNTKIKVADWKLHLEPKSRHRTVQRQIQYISILDCYRLCSSTPKSTSTRESCVYDPEIVPIYLNVYDLTPINDFLYWVGLGAHHSGVEVHGVEYAFGTDEVGNPGIFKMDPKNCSEFKFRKTVLIGVSKSGAKEIKKVINELSEHFKCKDYHLITNNCNHFSSEVCVRLTDNSIPPWVNRLSRIGSIFVRLGSWGRKKISKCRVKDAILEEDSKVLSRYLKKFRGSISSSSLSSSSSSSSFVASEIKFTGKSSRWKKSSLKPS